MIVGGYHYLHVAKPGLDIPLATQKEQPDYVSGHVYLRNFFFVKWDDLFPILEYLCTNSKRVRERHRERLRERERHRDYIKYLYIP